MLKTCNELARRFEPIEHARYRSNLSSKALLHIISIKGDTRWGNERIAEAMNYVEQLI